MKLLVLTAAGLQPAELDVYPGPTLMEFLRAFEDGVAARCGGILDCGSCHVYINRVPHGTLLPQASLEEEAKLAELDEARRNSRLACQVKLTPDLDGLVVEIAPTED